MVNSNDRVDSMRIVIKIGSSTLAANDNTIDNAYIESLAKQIAYLHEHSISVIVVSSGAIVCGLGVLGIATRPKDVPSLQAAASVGQSALVSTYASALSRFDIATSLVLLTRRDTADRAAYLHARDAFDKLLELGVVPIVNENDTTSVEQIRFGDNDTLAALVACLVGADRLIILSDIDGFYDADPRKCKNAKLISHISQIDGGVLKAAGGVGSIAGSGGMQTKVKAARVMMAAGIPMVVANGKLDNVIVDGVLRGNVGTLFEAKSTPHEITPRKLWIALGDSARGFIQVDDGAKTALIKNGSSLLPVGIYLVVGDFSPGDIVDLEDLSGYVFARGMVGISSDMVSAAKGKSSDELEMDEKLRTLANQPVIHRDDLVLFE